MPNSTNPAASSSVRTIRTTGYDETKGLWRLLAWFGLRRRISPGDAAMAAIGVSLAIVCALFPWYIFYNPDKFGIRALQFQGNQSTAAPGTLSPQPSRIGRPMTVHDVPTLDIELIATGTIGGESNELDAVDLADQPFPPDLIEYRLVHVANGRAMIADDDGLWIVQKGSRLPDSSRVASIEERDGRWVLTTTLDRVVEMSF
jgi:hypothetical protein